MAIGKKLDALLKARGKKPGTLATETGINKNTIYAIIKRDNEKVSMGTLEKIADALQISIDYFFDTEIDNYLNTQCDMIEAEKPALRNGLEYEELIRLFSSLPENVQNQVLDLVRTLSESHRFDEDQKVQG